MNNNQEKSAIISSDGKTTKSKPGETTKSIDNFTKDTQKIINKRDKVKFRIGKGSIEEGINEDFKLHIKAGGRGKVGDELAKIKCINTTRKKPICYIFFDEIISKLP